MTGDVPHTSEGDDGAVDLGSWPELPVPGARGAAWDALRGVYDPELDLDAVSLGPLYDVHLAHEKPVVEMTMMPPGCPASEMLAEVAHAAIDDALSGSVPVDVRVVWDPARSPAMIDAGSAAALGFTR